MNFPIRSLLTLVILAVAQAACGTTVGAPASETPTPSVPADPTSEPTVEPTEAPAPERAVDGTITVDPGAFSGPGGSIADAIANGPDTADNPSLVNGVLFRDIDGRIFLATAVSDTGAPTFDGPMLEVLDYPNEGTMWDMANAELLGLEEANGIVFKQDSQILG
ncbi:MAG TPA: hypothetical protein VLA76_05455, partial [Candidatus Angelobacter sp.]|nr:hypothetical protein [Candidatus Angelobacter sp.]